MLEVNVARADEVDNALKEDLTVIMRSTTVSGSWSPEPVPEVTLFGHTRPFPTD